MDEGKHNNPLEKLFRLAMDCMGLAATIINISKPARQYFKR
jgi:hypothetical protein